MAYRRGGWVQKLRGYYTFVFQLPWLPEWLLRSFNWLGFRLMTGYPEEQRQWQSQLARPGRLTAVLNYYCANGQLFVAGHAANARVPVLGVWSSGDRFLTEGQMRESARFVDASFRYTRIEGANHWLQLGGADKFNPVLLDYLEKGC